jgi:hypothetical protein
MFRYHVSNRLVSGGTVPTGWHLPAPDLEEAVLDIALTHVEAVAENHAIPVTPDASTASDLAKPLLSPRIQADILAGMRPPELILERIVKTGVPLDWDDQTHLFGFVRRTLSNPMGRFGPARLLRSGPRPEPSASKANRAPRPPGTALWKVRNITGEQSLRARSQSQAIDLAHKRHLEKYRRRETGGGGGGKGASRRTFYTILSYCLIGKMRQFDSHFR